MSRIKKSLVGKIGYVDNKVLGFVGKDGKPLKGGHYVYIRETDGARCNVNVITSLEQLQRDQRGRIVKDRYGEPLTEFVPWKIEKVKRGYLYPVPKKDSDFSLWSAINLDGNVNGIKIADIKNIGYKKMKQRHSWFVDKFHK